MDTTRTIRRVAADKYAAEPYAVLSKNNTLLTFYYDSLKEERNGYDVGPFNEKDERWGGHYWQIRTVLFDESFAACDTITSTAYWFYLCEKLTTIIGLKLLNTVNVTDMHAMFFACSSIESLELSRFQTGNVTNMSSMFHDCENLTILDLSGFISLDLSHFQIDETTKIRKMLDGCSSLTHLDWGKNERIRDMFLAEPYAVLSSDKTTLTFYYDCKKEARNGYDVGPFGSEDEPWGGYPELITTVVFDDSFAECNTITSTADWFWGCENLTTIIGIKNLNTEHVTDMSEMFCGCNSLTCLDLRGFNMNNVEDMTDMFNTSTNFFPMYKMG